MIKNCVLFGDSFSAEHWKSNITTYCGKIVAEKLKLNEINFARGGRGNDRIVAVCKTFFERYPENKKNSFVILQWTTPLRHDFPTEDSFKPFDNLDTSWRSWYTQKEKDLKWVMSQDGWDLDQYHSIRMILQILDLQGYFENNSIPYVMYHGMGAEIQLLNDDIKALYSAINNKRFFKLNESHFQYVLDKNLATDPVKNPHPNKEGHTHWANDLLAFIENNNLLDINK
jgi:hypothetical protein